MLDIVSDTAVVKAWLASALERGQSQGKSKTGLATACAVSPQAVTGWLNTGRITKSNLTMAAAYFGHSPSFVVPGHAAIREVPATYSASGWPFKLIDEAKLRRLSAEHLDRIETAIIAASAALRIDLTKRRAA